MDWILASFMIAIATGITFWIAGAIYYDLCRGANWGRIVAASWIVGVIVMFAEWRPLWQPFCALLGILAAFLGWWLRLKPSHDRDWEPCVAVLPRAMRDGDAITIESVRNFDYRSLDDFVPRYETRIYHLANLKGVDIIVFNWGSALMCHPVLVFDFGQDGRICFSIETRYRRGQPFSLIRSLYRQQELIFLAADERDVILRRTKFGSPQMALLYHLNAPMEAVRATFLDYIATINSIYDTPRWYHGVCANCTTSFYRLPSSRWRLDWRVLANVGLDRALYEDGLLDSGLSFEELQRLVYLNDIANAAPEYGFGDHIRHELENRRHGQ